MEEKWFLVLGGSEGQLQAIKKAKQMGLKALVVDKEPNCIGASVADHFEAIDTTDIKSIEEIARQFGIAGSLTMSSDVAVPTSCYINEALGIPTQGTGISEYVVDKVEMRRQFIKNKINCPKFYCVRNKTDVAEIRDCIEEYSKHRDFIVKPSDSSGSRGVKQISDTSQLQEVVTEAQTYSPKGKVIVEEFVEGTELGAQTFSMNGEMVYCFVHNDKVQNMVPVGHSLPSTLATDIVEKVRAECKKALKSLGIENGPSNIDIILDKNGTPFVIEIGARIGATKLPDICEVFSGVDLVSLSIELASGGSVQVSKELKYQPVAAEMLNFNHSGVIEKIVGFQNLVEKYKPLDYSINLKENQSVSKLVSGREHYGFVMFQENSVQEAEDKCTDFLKDLKSYILFAERVSDIQFQQ